MLLVDDEPAILRFLRTSLRAQGYQTIEVETGAQALTTFARNRIDVVVLDLGLPDLDGLEVLKLLRRVGLLGSDRAGSFPAAPTSPAKSKQLDLGADDYVTKPFGMDELLARLRAALRHRLQQQGEKPVFHSGDLSVDLVRRIVTVRGQEVKATHAGI